MRTYKKYPNRRLYDIEQSRYVTIEDIRKVILSGESISVSDSRTDKDLTRSVLMQIITEQEAEGHEPVLTDRALEQLIRFYGDAMQSVLGKYLEQSIMNFLEQQDRYRRNLRGLTSAEPLKLMKKAMEQNMEFWNRVTGSVLQPNTTNKNVANRDAADKDAADKDVGKNVSGKKAAESEQDETR